MVDGAQLIYRVVKQAAYMPLKGIEPPPGRAWAPPARNKFPASARGLLPDNYETLDQLAKCEALDAAGLLYWSKGEKGRPRWKKYLSAMPGVVAGDLVLDTPPVKGNERTGYPTQKPLALLERELGLNERQGILGTVIHRTDIPRPSETLPNYRTHRHTLYGQQEGLCNGCLTHFPFRNMTVDHIVAQSQGGSDHLENLQLLCNYCNSIKGANSQAYLIARLQEMGIR